jgi:hypothetical protein
MVLLHGGQSTLAVRSSGEGGIDMVFFDTGRAFCGRVHGASTDRKYFGARM